MKNPEGVLNAETARGGPQIRRISYVCFRIHICKGFKFPVTFPTSSRSFSWNFSVPAALLEALFLASHKANMLQPYCQMNSLNSCVRHADLFSYTLMPL